MKVVFPVLLEVEVSVTSVNLHVPVDPVQLKVYNPTDVPTPPGDPIDGTDAPPMKTDFALEFTSGTFVVQKTDGDYATYAVKYRTPKDGLIRFYARNAASHYTTPWDQGEVSVKAGEGQIMFSHKIVGALPTNRYDLSAQLYDSPTPEREQRPVASASKKVRRTIET